MNYNPNHREKTPEEKLNDLIKERQQEQQKQRKESK